MNGIDDNLALGVAQTLENLRRCGIHWTVQGDAAKVIQWYAAHAADFPQPSESSDLSLNASAPAEIPQPTTRAVPSTVPQKSAALASGGKPPVIHNLPVAVGKWESSPQDAQARVSFLTEQAEQVSICKRCTELVCSRTRTVYADGNPSSRIVFVGEGPGFEEDRTGIPFVGAAGQLLDKILVAMGLNREHIYIMNAVKCRPQNNRTPTDEEIANCQSFFITQLETVQPEYIVCLGAVASRAVLQTTQGIGKLRGRFHAYRGAKVAVTYHPAYLLRNPDAKKFTWDDMKMVMAAMAN